MTQEPENEEQNIIHHSSQDTRDSQEAPPTPTFFSTAAYSPRSTAMPSDHDPLSLHSNIKKSSGEELFKPPIGRTAR